MLALVGRNGIGRLGYSLPDQAEPSLPRALSKGELLSTKYTPEVFSELVAAYLSTGAGIAGMQPQIMVPDRPTVPIPSLIVKAASPAYPGLAANEYLCLTAAKHAGIDVPSFALSDDGQMLVLDRFDLVIHDDGRAERLGFDDVWLAPVFEVVTTSIYKYTQSPGGPEFEDRMLALKLFAGKHQKKTYPTTEELVDFGRRVCGVAQSAEVLARIVDAMGKTMSEAKGDARVTAALWEQMAQAWEEGRAHAQ